MECLSRTEKTPEKRAMKSLSLASAPPPVVTSALKEAKIDQETALDYLRCSRTPEALLLVQCYDSLMPTERKAITIDHLCAAAKDKEGNSIDPSRCLGIITEQMFSHKVSVTNLLAAANAPKVMEKSIRFAGMRDGYQDRKMLLQTVGVAPTPKTQTNYLNISGNKIDKSVHINSVPTLESVVGELDLDKIIDAEV